MKREWRCPIGENTLYLTDTIRNYGDTETPHMILYHMNMGYPILSEEATLYIPSETVTPRDARAAEGLDAWNVVLPPQPQFKEQCYYHTFQRGEEAYAAIFNPAVGKGVKIVFHPEELDCFTQWKMLGCYGLGARQLLCRGARRHAGKRDIEGVGSWRGSGLSSGVSFY